MFLTVRKLSAWRIGLAQRRDCPVSVNDLARLHSTLSFFGWLRSRPFANCLVGLLLFAGIPAAAAFSLNGYSWPAGSQISMHLQLSRPPVPLQDGSSSWNASAADALAIWNQHLDTVSFVEGAGSGPAGNDGANSVFFSNNVYGDTFPSGVLAVTLHYSNGGGVFTETDVIFNNSLKWNSYRGPIQGVGLNTTYDLHRVALHEFGHVLGLDHPDESGQSVMAIMNSVLDDLDQLADDDIAGAKALYRGPALTAYLGADFAYQVVTNNNPSSYMASGLPPGLTIDPASGLISGVATISGTYPVVVTVNHAAGSSSRKLQITVTAPSSNSNPGALLRKLNISVNRLAADPARSRVYATVPASNSVAVIDTTTFSIIKTIPIGSNPMGLALSADRSKLWVANSGSTTAAIGVVDLNTLQALPSLSAPFAPYDVEEGLNNRLYVTSDHHGIMQIDGNTGEFHGAFYGASFLEISPDRKTLFVAPRNVSGAYVTKFDVSTATAVLQQNVFGQGQDLKLSPTGEFLCFFIGSSTGSAPYHTLKTPTSNLSLVSGYFDSGGTGGVMGWSGDGHVLYQGMHTKSSVAIFDTNSLARTGQFSLRTTPNDSNDYRVRDLVVENTGAYLFVATFAYPNVDDLRVYATGRTNVTAPVPPKSLLNVSTRLRVQTQDNALIGGFIIQGNESKKVVLRAIGPSLPVSDRLTDPALTLYDSAGNVVASNDNWNATRQAVLDFKLAPDDEHEPVIVASLAAGSYTAVVRGANDSTGIGLVELYDVDSTHSRVANISTRGKVESGDNVMIGGFIIGGDQPTKVIVRAIGPSLGAHGVAHALQDPILKLHDGNGSLITENDDWRSLQEEAIENSGVPPRDGRESAIVATLPPGSYTAVVSGKDGASGVGLVEIYNLESD